MSRIGKQPVIIPEKVDVKINGDFIEVSGPKGKLSERLVPDTDVKIEELDGVKQILVSVSDPEIKTLRSRWGLQRNLINNMILGVTNGFEKKLEINGVGYKAELKGDKLILNVGFSHQVEYKLPEGISGLVEKNVITISGIDKQLVGQVTAEIRDVKKPEPYKGKGIKYIDEVIKRKKG